MCFLQVTLSLWKATQGFVQIGQIYGNAGKDLLVGGGAGADYLAGGKHKDKIFTCGDAATEVVSSGADKVFVSGKKAPCEPYTQG